MFHSRWFLPVVIPVLFLPVLYLALASTAPASQLSAAPAAPTAPASSCVPSLEKSIDPSTIPMGDSVQASLIVSATCAAKLLPVDLIIVADESFSMTRAKDGGSDPGGGEPTEEPEPGETPEPDPGGGPTKEPSEGGEPGFCVQKPADIPPTATRTPRRPPRFTPTPGSGEPEKPTEQAELGSSEDLIKEEKAWIQEFLGQPEIERDLKNDRLHIGFVGFSESARIKQGLTNSASKITAAAARMRGADYTYVGSAMLEASRMLDGSGARDENGDAGRVKLIILMSDFQFCLRDMRAVRNNTDVITIGYGRGLNRRNHRDMASERELALEKQDLQEVVRLYERILAPPKPIAMQRLTVRDTLADNMRLMPGSVSPVTVTVTGQLIEWAFDLPTLPLRLAYDVQPQDSGMHPISASAEAEWTDSDGLVGRGTFPVVEVEVLAMTATPTFTPTYTPTPTNTPTSTYTPTPTSTHTPTSTPTPVPQPAYLPIVFRNWPEEVKPTPCVPEEQKIDLAMVIDNSTSMLDPTQAGGKRKIDAAVEAAIEIVGLLKATDQATIVSFNSAGHLASMLTGDKATLTAALQGLPASSAAGTAIDAGLLTALGELQSTRHLAGNKRSMILVTDGTQTVGGSQPVRDAANAVKSAGVTLVTVGLGAEVDEALLTEIASSPDLFYKAPNAENLLDIYREIARLIPCP